MELRVGWSTEKPQEPMVADYAMHSRLIVVVNIVKCSKSVVKVVVKV